MPSELIIEITPEGPGGSMIKGHAQLRARAWIELPAVDLRIVPARGDVHYDRENGSVKIEITLAALRTKPPEPQIIIPP
jgi:hypothetical protein